MADKFGLTLVQLRELMENRGLDGKEKMEQSYGGIEKLVSSLKSSIPKGLDANDKEDQEQRTAAFGQNFIPPQPPQSFLSLMWEAAQDITLIILVVAAVISIVLGLTVENDFETGWIEGAAILISVCLVIFVTAGNDWSKERQFKSLQMKLEDDADISCIRNGESVKVFTKDILVGDVVQLGYGDIIPADGLYLSGNDLSVDESTLTGETDHVKKSVEVDPMLLSGTSVMEGSCKMVVTAVGPNSQSGIIVKLIEGRDDDSDESDEEVKEVEGDAEEGTTMVNGNGKAKTAKPSNKKEKSVLQGKLTRLAIQIGYFGTVAAVLTILVLIIKFCVAHFMFGVEKCKVFREATAVTEWKMTLNATDCIDSLLNGELGSVEMALFKGWDPKYIKELLEYFIIGVTVLVVAVPEGLPLAVTISLAYSVRKMMKDNNLVRHLDACETMGNATAICSDKTGTLTTNRMSVVQSFFMGKLVKHVPSRDMLTKEVIDVFAKSVSINSSYSSKVIKSAEVGQLPKHLGNKTECALLQFTGELGEDYEAIRKENPEEGFFKVYTFNSKRKCMATVLKTETGWRIFIKGAGEVVLGLCTSILGEDGSPVPLTPTTFDRLAVEVIESMASESLRTICVAYKDVEEEPDWDDEEGVLKKLTCISVVGIEDPVRPEVPQAIKNCQRAGVTIRMVTGDNLITARSIAKKCGILAEAGDGGNVLEGKTFHKLVHDDNGQFNQDKFDVVWPQLRVLARSSPTDKYVLVTGIINSKLSKNREVVAVTGDGTNDAPALKAADVGFAMGIAGTDVAKNASDIILTDDNFTSIVKACMWGRNVYDSISKFLQFQLTVNVVAVMLCFIGSCAHGASPLRAVPMLWVNLIMDTFASLALATEPPTEDLLKRKPYGRTKPLISRTMLKNIIGHTFYQMIVMLLILFYGVPLFKLDKWAYEDDAPTTHGTLLFNIFVWMQIFNEVNSRKVHGERNVFKGIFNNYIFVGVVVGTSIAQVILVEFGGHAFSTNGLNWSQWLICIGVGAGELVWGQIVATVPKTVIPTGMRLGTQPFTQEEANQARMLWMRSLKRVQHQIRVANAFKKAGHERHRRLSLLAEASSNSLRTSNSDGSVNPHWWAKKPEGEGGVRVKSAVKSASQPLLEGDEEDTNV